jgi:hypothetical protein
LLNIGINFLCFLGMLHVRPVPNFILSLYKSFACVIFSITSIPSLSELYGGKCALDYSGNRTTERKLCCVSNKRNHHSLLNQNFLKRKCHTTVPNSIR